MIAFIAPETENHLEVMRNRLLANSMDIIRLFSQRIALSREIARVKNSAGIDFRVRERELDVIRKLDLGDFVLNSILNSLFEFSIRCQESSSMASNAASIPAETTLRGDEDGLLWILGRLISAPGVEFYSVSNIPDILRISLQYSGGHIINGAPPSEAVDICIGFSNKGCSVEMPDSNTLVLRNLSTLTAPLRKYRIVTS